MRRLALVAVLAAGCTEHGSQPPPGGDDLGPGFETARFVPQLCTGSGPADPTCPLNQIDLAESGAPGQFAFIMQLLNGAMFLSNISVTALDDGLALEGLTLRVWTTDTTPIEIPFDTPIELNPHVFLALGSRAVVTADTTRPMSLRVSAAGPHRP